MIEETERKEKKIITRRAEPIFNFCAMIYTSLFLRGEYINTFGRLDLCMLTSTEYYKANDIPSRYTHTDDSSTTAIGILTVETNKNMVA